MDLRLNLSVIPGRSAGSSPEPITTGRAGQGAAKSDNPVFMDSGLDASRRPGKTV